MFTSRGFPLSSLAVLQFLTTHIVAGEQLLKCSFLVIKYELPREAINSCSWWGLKFRPRIWHEVESWEICGVNDVICARTHVVSHTPDGKMSPEEAGTEWIHWIPWGRPNRNRMLTGYSRDPGWARRMLLWKSLAASKEREGGSQARAPGNLSIAPILAEEEFSG